MFVVHQIPPGSAQSTEPLGTKYKFWYRDPNFGVTLFKEGRPGTGENWAERIACELAVAIELPHAKYELARCGDRWGVISWSLVARNARIIHGNELLAAHATGYVQGMTTQYRNPNHTLRRVLAYLRRSSDIVGAPYGWKQTSSVKSALDFFIGYLMFDAWIANQDRHDENWALLRADDGNLFLCPSFDHGSSMARNEPDARRLERLKTNDMQRHISTFVQSARSAFYPHRPGPVQRPMSTLEAFVQAAAQSQRAAKEWRDRLRDVDDQRVRAIINQVPADWMTEPAREFTAELLRLNRKRILTADLA